MTQTLNVIAFNGSARKGGNTNQLIQYVFEELENADLGADLAVATEIVELAGKPLRGCTACYQCAKNKNKRCVLDSDDLNAYLEKMYDAAAIILASPTYFSNVSAEMKALIDRAGFVARANGDLLKRKIGAAVVAVRRAGGIHVFNSLNHFFFISQMIVPGSSYWNIGIGLDKGDVAGDDEGVKTMRDLGRNLAWLLAKTHGES